jgi:hypothetical protein
MKRDLQLVRKILIHFEEKDTWTYEDNVKIEGYDDKLVSYHIDIMYEAGLLNGEPTRTKEGRIYDVLPFRLTWEGHEFLDNTKGGRWNKILNKIMEKGGDFTFEMVKKLATKFAEDQLFG